MKLSTIIVFMSVMILSASAFANWKKAAPASDDAQPKTLTLVI